MKLIIDTNLWISFLIGKRLKQMQYLFLRDDIQVYMCDELLNEVLEVANRPKLSKYISDDDVELFEKLVHTFAYFVKIDHVSKLPIRDSKDLYLLSLCETVPADFILTGDEDLLSVDTKNCNYKIMRFNDFMIKILQNS